MSRDVSRQHLQNIFTTSAWEQRYLVSQNPQEVFAFCAALSEHGTPVECEENGNYFRKCMVTVHFLFQHWPCADPHCWAWAYEEIKWKFTGLDVWNFRGWNCSLCTRLSPHPSSTTAEHNCGFCTAREKTTCKQKLPRKAELMKLWWDLKQQHEWPMKKEERQPCAAWLGVCGTISTIVKAGRKACQLVNRHFLGNFLDVAGGEKLPRSSALLHSWHTLCAFLTLCSSRLRWEASHPWTLESILLHLQKLIY